MIIDCPTALWSIDFPILFPFPTICRSIDSISTIYLIKTQSDESEACEF